MVSRAEVRRRTAARVTGIAVLLLTLVLVAACGDDDTNDAGAAATDATTEGGDAGGSEPPELTQATVAYGNTPVASQWAVWVAIDRGFFSDRGLEVEFVNVPTGTEMVSSLIGGSLDFSGPGGDAVLRGIESGADLRLLLAQTEGIQGQIAMSRSWADEKGIDETSSDVEYIEALRGARLGSNLPGGSIHGWTLATLDAYGLDPESDVDLQFIEGGSGLLSAFEAGRLDAFIHAIPTGNFAEERRDAVLFPMRELSKLPDFGLAPQTFFTTTAAFIEEHPDTVQAFVDAILEAHAFIVDNRPEAEESLTARIEGFPEGAIEEVHGMAADTDLILTEEMFAAAKRLAEAATDEPIDVTFDQAVETRFAET